MSRVYNGLISKGLWEEHIDMNWTIVKTKYICLSGSVAVLKSKNISIKPSFRSTTLQDYSQHKYLFN